MTKVPHIHSLVVLMLRCVCEKYCFFNIFKMRAHSCLPKGLRPPAVFDLCGQRRRKNRGGRGWGEEEGLFFPPDMSASSWALDRRTGRLVPRFEKQRDDDDEDEAVSRADVKARSQVRNGGSLYRKVFFYGSQMHTHTHLHAI